MMKQQYSFSDADFMQALMAIDASMVMDASMVVQPVPEERLVRYAFGWSTEADEDQILDALTHSRSLRQDLIQIRHSLDQPEARSTSVKEFLDYAIGFAARALESLERGVTDWKSSFEGKLVVQHALDSRSDRLANLPGQVAWARSPVLDADNPFVIDSLIVDSEFGAPSVLPIAAGPIARNGEIEFDVEFDSQFLSDHADQSLGISFAAGPLDIPLRAWKVSELPRDGHLSAPIPSTLAGPVPRTAIKLSLIANP